MGWKREEREEREREKEGEKRERERIYITYQFIILKTLFNLIKKKNHSFPGIYLIFIFT